MKKSAVRRFGLPVIVTIAAAAALTGLTDDVSARGAARPEEETAPRQAGEPIMAVVSIKSQNVTFYDADGWILKAPGRPASKDVKRRPACLPFCRRTSTIAPIYMTTPTCRTCSA